MKPRLVELYEEDQAARETHPRYGANDYLLLRRHDERRRDEARAIVSAQNDISAIEMYCAAMIFQHSDELADIKLGYEWAMRAAREGYRPARFLAAASIDRWLMYQGLPQKYGTNIVPDGRRQRVWDVDPAITDEDRAEWDVPSLAEMEERARQVTAEEPMPPMDEAPAWLKTAIERWREIEKW